MLKTLCLLALIATVYNQDVVNQGVQAADNSDPVAVANGAQQAVQGVTVGDVVNAVQGQADNINAAAASINANVPVLDSFSVGYGKRGVIVTPQAANPTLNDWINGVDNVERQAIQNADGEWDLQWSVQGGDDYYFVKDKNSGDLVVVDLNNNNRLNWGSNDALDAEIAHGAEDLVNYVWDNEVSTIQGSTVLDWLANVLNNENVDGFLQDNANTSVNDVANEAANQAQANSGAINNVVNQVVDTVGQQAANVAGGVNVDQAVDAANQAVNAANNAVNNAVPNVDVNQVADGANNVVANVQNP